MKKFASILFAVMGISGMSHAQTSEEYEAAKAAIWAKEQAIYKARAEVGLDYYIDNASENYVGWPPGVPAPTPLSQLKENNARMTAPNSEKLELFFDDLALHGDTAVIYYNTHRTMLPNGTVVDQRYHICHVWVRDETGDWLIVGAMGRLESE
jgi:ketosteroid isomerase-like protein